MLPKLMSDSRMLTSLETTVLDGPAPGSPLPVPWEDRAASNLLGVESALRGDVRGGDGRPACQLLALQTQPPPGSVPSPARPAPLGVQSSK